MKTYGYARTSTVEQVAGLADQISKLKWAGCTDQSIYQEQISSVRMEDRVEFAKVLSVLRAGDVLVFSSLSRAARSMIHMVEIDHVATITARELSGLLRASAGYHAVGHEPDRGAATHGARGHHRAWVSYDTP